MREFYENIRPFVLVFGGLGFAALVMLSGDYCEDPTGHKVAGGSIALFFILKAFAAGTEQVS